MVPDFSTPLNIEVGRSWIYRKVIPLLHGFETNENTFVHLYMCLRRRNTPKNLLHGFSFGQFIDEFVQVSYLSHQWVLNRIDLHTTDFTSYKTS